MGASKKIKLIALERNVPLGGIAQARKISASTMYNKIARDSWKYNEVERIADMLDFDIVFKDRKTGKEY